MKHILNLTKITLFMDFAGDTNQANRRKGSEHTVLREETCELDFTIKGGENVFCNGGKSRTNFPADESVEWNINV